MDIKNLKIAIVGCGNLGRSIVDGFLKSGISASKLTVSDRRVQLLDDLAAKGICVGKDNKIAVAEADIIIVAVKPYQAVEVITDIQSVLRSGQLVASTITGISIAQLKELLPSGVIPIRVMPNTAIALQESMTLIAAPDCSEEQINMVKELFESLGKVIFIDEELMAAATVLGACGIAFALRFIRAAIQGGVEIGFSADVAQQIVAQTVKGASELILQTGHHPEQEIDKVTTPKGITISGLNEMEHRGFSSSLIRGLVVSYNKVNNTK